MIYPLCGCKPQGQILVEERVQAPIQTLVEQPIKVDEELAQKLIDLDRLRLKIKRTKQRKDFSLFFKEAWAAQNPGTVLEWGAHIQAVCDHLQWMAEDRARAKEDPNFKLRAQNLLINVPPRSLKPVHEDGLVVEKTRGLVPLKTIEVGDQILTHRGRFRRVEQVAVQGELPLLEISTGRGRKIRAAGDHPFLTQRGWVNAEDLTTSDVLAETHAQESAGTQTLPHEEARLLGYLIGDGSLAGNAVRFTNQDSETLADFEACAASLNFTTERHATRSRATDLYVKGGHGVLSGVPRSQRKGVVGPVRAWLRSHDLEGKTSYTKRVPRAIMGADEATVVDYLAAYWACDGDIHDRRDLPRKSGGVTQTVRVSATTVSEGLARDHQALLQRLGLRFRVRRKENKKLQSKRQGSTYVSWDIVASDQDTTAKFMQVVGARINHEKRTRAQGLQRCEFDRVLYADEVVAITPVAPGPCRCLQVEEDSSFVYEGVAVHNTMILTYWTVWVWLRWPGMRIMYLSANPRVALNSARQARDLILSSWFQKTHEPEWEIRTDQNALSDLGNSAGGARIARGLDSTITGEGCDALCIDDPHDLRDSIENIEKVIEGYDSAVGNRINDPRTAIRIAIMQRVNVMDFAAHVLRQGWCHVRIPMEYEAKPMCSCKVCQDGVNPFGWKDTRTVEGEVLHPRFTPSFLENERIRLGPFGYAAQMQQRPAVAGGGRLKKEYWGFFRLSGHHAGDHPRPAGCDQTSPSRVVERHKSGWNRGKLDLDWTVITVDAANKKTERGSAYGLLAMGGKEMRRFILDDRTQRGEFTDILEIIRDMIIQWRPDKLLVEAKAAGPSLMASLEDEMSSGRLRAHDYDINRNAVECKGRVVEGVCKGCGERTEGTPITCPIEAIEVDMDKERRVDAVLPQIAARLVYLLEGARWGGDFVEEHALFPESPWNDRVDALTQVLEAYREGPFYVL